MSINTSEARMILEKVALREPKAMKAVRALAREQKIYQAMLKAQARFQQAQIKSDVAVTDVVYEDAFKSPMERVYQAQNKLNSKRRVKRTSPIIIDDDEDGEDFSNDGSVTVRPY